MSCAFFLCQALSLSVHGLTVFVGEVSETHIQLTDGEAHVSGINRGQVPLMVSDPELTHIYLGLWEVIDLSLSV